MSKAAGELLHALAKIPNKTSNESISTARFFHPRKRRRCRRRIELWLTEEPDKKIIVFTQFHML